jgi:catechol 2,3-dioxygenase-like lactoylglutathione lyase family enzyme
MTKVAITGFDHLVLKCADVDKTLAWYVDELGLAPVRVEEWRAGRAPFPSARVSEGTIIDFIGGGGGDGRNVDHLCLVADRATVEEIGGADSGFDVLDGPVTRYGARGDGWSVYVQDPDGMVVEIRSYDG